MYHQYYLSQILLVDLQNTFMQKVTICNSPLSMLIRSKWTTQTNNTVALLSSVSQSSCGAPTAIGRMFFPEMMGY